MTNKIAARKALFLDRDGVINEDLGYVHNRKDFIFNDGIFELTSHAIEKNYLIIVITNQAGIGKGFYSEKDFFKLASLIFGNIFDPLPIKTIFGFSIEFRFLK